METWGTIRANRSGMITFSESNAYWISRRTKLSLPLAVLGDAHDDAGRSLDSILDACREVMTGVERTPVEPGLDLVPEQLGRQPFGDLTRVRARVADERRARHTAAHGSTAEAGIQPGYPAEPGPGPRNPADLDSTQYRHRSG